MKGYNTWAVESTASRIEVFVAAGVPAGAGGVGPCRLELIDDAFAAQAGADRGGAKRQRRALTRFVLVAERTDAVRRPAGVDRIARPSGPKAVGEDELCAVDRAHAAALGTEHRRSHQRRHADHGHREQADAERSQNRLSAAARTRSPSSTIAAARRPTITNV